MYRPNPDFPLAHAYLDFWNAVDRKIYAKQETFAQAIQPVSDWILQQLEYLVQARIPLPYDPPIICKKCGRGLSRSNGCPENCR